MKLNGTEVPATARQIDHWVRQGYLHPANPNPGQGVPYRWTARQVRHAEMMARLVGAGLTPASASFVAHMGGENLEVALGVRIDVCLSCAHRQPCARHHATEPGGSRQTDGEDD